MKKSSWILHRLIIGLTGLVCFAIIKPPAWHCSTDISGVHTAIGCLWDTHPASHKGFEWNPKELLLEASKKPTAPQKILETSKFKEFLTASPFEAITQSAALTHGVDANLVRAIILVESNYRPGARSTAGAGGLMQLTASTAKYLGVHDRFDPHQNIHGGSLYLKQLLKRFNNNIEFALAAYNAGPEAVRRHGGIPPYKQTRNYVKKVLYVYRAMSSKQMA